MTTAIWRCETKLLITGHIFLIICGAFYLAWWCYAFYPGYRGSRVTGIAGILLLITAITGLAGVSATIMGIMEKGTREQFIPGTFILFGSVSLYILLLIISSRLLHRQVTTELLLIILWTALEISSYQSAYCAEWIEAGMMWFLIILIGVCAVISLYFYLQFYRVNADRGYVYGMIPLILVEICMVIFLFSGILRRIP